MPYLDNKLVAMSDPEFGLVDKSNSQGLQSCLKACLKYSNQYSDPAPQAPPKDILNTMDNHDLMYKEDEKHTGLDPVLP